MPTARYSIAAIMAVALSATASLTFAHHLTSSWESTKNRAADHVYAGYSSTFYCGCPYDPGNNSTGGSPLDMAECGMTPLPKHAGASAERIEWEHIVPASLMTARDFSCWAATHQFDECDLARRRACCATVSDAARRMIFDLHNLAPALGQINQYRSNARYGEVPDNSSPDEWDSCAVQNLKEDDMHVFEPADCTKGDVARVWFYMHERYGVRIPDGELAMFIEWSELDPVSPWELERDRRIAEKQLNHNPFVVGQTPDEDGACPWEPEVGP